MGRAATKAASNIWYQARMEAAKGNEKLLSRFGAADEAGMSEDAIKNTELGLEKCMPVDKAVILADLYGAPELLNHYCLNECPIGRNRAISAEVLPIERITCKLVKLLKSERVEKITDSLLDIAEDGEVSKEERESLRDAVAYLETLSKAISELKIVSEKQ